MIAKGKVIDINDPLGGNRIKVEISAEDKYKVGLGEKSMWAVPFMPQIFHVKPKEEECVIVITEGNDLKGQRFYIGPIISQPQKMDFDNFFAGATSLMMGNIKAPEKNILNKSIDIKGCYAKDEEIAIYSRKNTDIILSDNDIRIRCGVRVKTTDETIIFNKDNPAFLKIERYPETLKDSGNTQTTATLVAEEINLISTKGTPYFVLNDIDKSISNEEMINILNQAHLLPYGDILVDILEKLIQIILTHVHPYHGSPAVPDGMITAFNTEYGSNFLKEKLLSRHIRIN